MANTLEYILTLKDNFTSSFKLAASEAGISSKSIIDSAMLIGMGVGKIAPISSAGFNLLKGDYAEFGTILGMLPGPIGQVTGAIGKALGSAIDETVKYSEAMRKASAATGASVAFMSQFTEAADDQFVSQETVIASLTRFSKALGGAMDMEGGFNASGKGAAAILKDMGITALDATGQVLPLEQLIPQLADKFQQMGPSAKTTALAMQLFGRQGAELLPVLLQGSKAMEASMQAAKDMGLAIDDHAVAAVKRLKQQQDALGDSQTALGRQISIAVVPALANVTEGLNLYMAKANEISAKGMTTTRIVESLGNAYMFLTGQLKGAETALDDSATKLAAFGGATGEANVTQRQLTDTMRDAIGSYQNAAVGIKSYGDATAISDQQSKAFDDTQKNILGTLSGTDDVLTAAQLAVTAYKIATGELTVQQFDQQQAVKALMSSYENGGLTLKELTEYSLKLKAGTMTSGEAFDRAGVHADNYIGDLVRVKAAALQASDSLNRIPSGKNVTLNATAGPSWNDIFGPRGLANGLQDSSVTKRLYGALDGSFTAARDYWYSIQNGVATAHVFTSVTIDYNPPACFVAGTLVSTPDGDRPIERLHIGDAVYAYDHEARQTVVSTVTETLAHEPRGVMRIVLGTGMTILCTPEHVIYAPVMEEYIAARRIERGFRLMDSSGNLIPVVLVEHDTGISKSVYNLHVDRHHNYYAAHVLVHNAKSSLPSGGVMPNNIGINNTFGAGMNQKQTAQLVQQAQASATRQALLRASIGG